jgi:signal transduction histidine kinase/FixJ family two-component response regulator
MLPGFATNEPARLLELGVATRPLRYQAEGHSPFFGDSLICRGELLRQRPDLVNRFRRACLRGWSWALSNREDAVRLISDGWTSAYQPSSPQHLLKEAVALDPIIDRTVIDLGTISIPRLEAIAAQMRAVQQPGLVRRELVWQPADPSSTWLSLTIWALGIAGTVCLVLLLGIVVTRRRLLGATLTQQRIMDLAESFMLFHAKAEGTSRLRLVHTSPSISAILGGTRSSYQSDPDALLRQVLGDDRPPLLEALTAAISRRQAVRHRFRIAHPDHEKPRHLLLQAIPLPGSEPLEFDGMILDLTAEADAAEALLEVQRRLQTAQRNESLGLLAGGVAHDFNNLLGAIRGNAELAMSRLPDSHEARPRLQRVLQASDRAAGLVRQILAYAGKGTIEVRPINLIEECRVLRDLLKHAIPANVRLDLISPQNLPEVQFDPAQLQQVLVNLIVNAAEAYEGAEGTVTIKLTALAGEPASIAVEISDRGCGMSAETQARMFEPYFTTKKTGHGLGLAAVQGIITASGSHMSYLSRVGHGTTFTLRIPVVARRIPQGRVESPYPVAGKHVLVVDDDEMMRDLASQMVRELGYVVDSAAGGEEALRRLGDPNRTYAAAILDCAMPDLDGTEVARRLRAADDRLPLVLCSGMVESNRIGTGILDRRTRFLAKPFSKAMLDRTLRLLLRTEGGDDDSSSSTFASMQRESSVFLSIRSDRDPKPRPRG